MKFLKYISIFVLAVVMTGCEDYFGEDANVDPDNPTSATVNVLLPQVQARLVYTYGGDFTRYLGINTQHVDGVGRQFVVINNYGIVPADVDAAWRNIYSGILNSNQVMKDLATESGANHYNAIGLILESYAIMIATDAWGDIPYSDAIKFAANGGVYAPGVDSQEDIYNAIFANLSQARTLLEGDDGGSAVGADDLIYDGDVASWIRFANAIEARGKLHLSKVNGTSAYTDALAAANAAFTSAVEQAGFSFGEGATENAPWYQYIEQRDDCEVGSFYTDLLTSLADPRILSYGAEHALTDASPAHPVFAADQTVNLISYTEIEFIKAEALMQTGDAAGAFDAFTSAVISSMGESLANIDSIPIGGVNVAVADTFPGVVADYIDATYGTSVNMEDIMTQKYLALYTSPEVFNDWRRTGLPALTPNTGADVPRRLPYSEAEQFANANIPSPAQITIFDRVWWDQ